MEQYDFFLNRFSQEISQLFQTVNINNRSLLDRKSKSSIWENIMEFSPLSVAVPVEFGGRGCHVKECLGILSAASYESLALSLTFGINIALFLQPLAKYGSEVKERIFHRFIREKAMGGLMITEPDYGTDALNMRTFYENHNSHFSLKGEKHWQGLTGIADFWIVAAREKLAGGQLSRDIGFFITDNEERLQNIHVTDYYQNLGLHMIPYGRNQIDIKVPANQMMEKRTTGIKMMLDILHRSRLQFAGMGMGFIKRMLDESLAHCQNRILSGNSLLELDMVQFQLSRIQYAYTICTGMCTRSTTVSGIEHDVSGMGLEANTIKALLTDLMHESAQLCLQLTGAKGYNLDHVAGRGFIDSRPFQIFEGANDMLYNQIGDLVVRQMKISKIVHFGRYLGCTAFSHRSAPIFKKHFDFNIQPDIKPRQSVVLGKITARLVALQYVLMIEDKGFRKDLIENCVKHIEMDIKQLLSNFQKFNNAKPILNYEQHSNWSTFV